MEYIFGSVSFVVLGVGLYFKLPNLITILALGGLSTSLGTFIVKEAVRTVLKENNLIHSD